MRRLLQSVFAPLAIVAAIALIWMVWHYSISEQAEQVESVSEKSLEIVTLTEEKLSLSHIGTSPAVLRVHQKTATVPGRITYDENRHVEVRVATAGVIVKLFNKPGDIVNAGQLLAVISSPEIGSARADQATRAAAVDIAQRKLVWEQSRHEGVQRIAAAIEQRMDSAKIRGLETDSRIGAEREKLLSAYSNLLLAEANAKRTRDVAGTGAVPGRLVQERIGQFEAASAALQGQVEQALFETRQEFDSAKAALEDVQRRYRIAARQVATLLGEDDSDVDLLTANRSLPDDLSRVEVLAPIKGTIERKIPSETERVEPGDSLYILADTSSVWVSADLRESQWGSLSLAEGDKVHVELPAFENERFEAILLFIGREVNPLTNSIPLVLAMSNANARLRPGLFASIFVPLGQPAELLMVPEPAVVQHEGKKFVFVLESTNSFRRRDVEVGINQDNWIEIKSGLKAGEMIVSSGAFVLKSELLLESEE